jgi:1-acyl-sn-glycerol-3-phosphate acyltransferase
MSISVLKNGNILGIFPDGGVSYNLLSKPKNGAVFLSNLGSAPIVPMSIYGAERAWEGALRGIRSRVCVNIGKPFGPYKLSGNKKDKEKILNRVGREMMCRIASLLPENQRGHFKNEKKIINRLQKQNKIIPDDHRYFKPAPE